MQGRHSLRAPRPARRELRSAGWSLLELLAAGVLLLVALLAAAGLHVRSLRDVEYASRRSLSARLAQDGVEAAIAASRLGATPEEHLYFQVDSEEWHDERGGPMRPRWERTVTASFFLLEALEDGRLEESEARSPDELEPGLCLVRIRVTAGPPESPGAITHERVDWCEL